MWPLNPRNSSLRRTESISMLSFKDRSYRRKLEESPSLCSLIELYISVPLFWKLGINSRVVIRIKSHEYPLNCQNAEHIGGVISISPSPSYSELYSNKFKEKPVVGCIAGITCLAWSLHGLSHPVSGHFFQILSLKYTSKIDQEQ